MRGCNLSLLLTSLLLWLLIGAGWLVWRLARWIAAAIVLLGAA